jgi:hypothetical protein
MRVIAGSWWGASINLFGEDQPKLEDTFILPNRLSPEDTDYGYPGNMFVQQSLARFEMCARSDDIIYKNDLVDVSRQTHPFGEE